MISLLVALGALLYISRAYALAFVTVYLVHFTWCQLIHVSIFSFVGQARIRASEKVDWRELAFKRELNNSTKDDVIMDGMEHGGVPGSVGTPWQDVVHFV